eukprot:75351-Chlamydomonas_euryale.AAC.1
MHAASQPATQRTRVVSRIADQTSGEHALGEALDRRRAPRATQRLWHAHGVALHRDLRRGEKLGCVEGVCRGCRMRGEAKGVCQKGAAPAGPAACSGQQMLVVAAESVAAAGSGQPVLGPACWPTPTGWTTAGRKTAV